MEITAHNQDTAHNRYTGRTKLLRAKQHFDSYQNGSLSGEIRNQSKKQLLHFATIKSTPVDNPTHGRADNDRKFLPSPTALPAVKKNHESLARKNINRRGNSPLLKPREDKADFSGCNTTEVDVPPH